MEPLIVARHKNSPAEKGGAVACSKHEAAFGGGIEEVDAFGGDRKRHPIPHPIGGLGGGLHDDFRIGTARAGEGDQFFAPEIFDERYPMPVARRKARVFAPDARDNGAVGETTTTP